MNNNKQERLTKNIEFCRNYANTCANYIRERAESKNTQVGRFGCLVIFRKDCITGRIIVERIPYDLKNLSLEEGVYNTLVDYVKRDCGESEFFHNSDIGCKIAKSIRDEMSNLTNRMGYI